MMIGTAVPTIIVGTIVPIMLVGTKISLAAVPPTLVGTAVTTINVGTKISFVVIPTSFIETCVPKNVVETTVHTNSLNIGQFDHKILSKAFGKEPKKYYWVIWPPSQNVKTRMSIYGI